MKRILLAGGNSGGHIYPGWSLARALADRGIAEVLFLDHGTALERKILEGCDLETLAPPWQGVGTIHQALLRVIPALGWLREQRIDAVIALGARPGVAVGIAASLSGKPLFILEQNKVMGLANKLLTRFARKIFLSWPIENAPRGLRSRTALLGCPVRDRFVPSQPMSSGLPELLIMGGSQGSEAVNESILEAATHLRQPGAFRVHHICGAGKAQGIEDRWRCAGVDATVRSYLDNPAQALIDASLIVSRAGGSTVAEVCCVGRAALYWPFLHHGDQHQLRNASHVAHHGGAMVVDQESPQQIADLIESLIQDRSRLEQMSICSRQLGRPGAAQRIAEMVATHLGERIGISGSDDPDLLHQPRLEVTG
ncbi:MAG: UDP-N-acetylglucosamine--N-acetylmuramyl-(pentapeptide) pyrophosphoryl-undecaprenol N-acetylglucosamine transferase [Planctomycetota bacterium]|nr:UDP-N-acetylglucosamine--N-acetylmuramyl-(pentapeptide) pyrophosphoryl-undecaprenol N-acetylglucosamine transferase [Planctomycetota bacterium]